MAVADFSSAFVHNYYLTDEFAFFCSRITRQQLISKKLGSLNLHILKGKNVSISNYSLKDRRAMQKSQISYLSVLPEKNIENPTHMEYTIIHHVPFEEAYSRMDRTFQKNVRRSMSNPHKFHIARKLNAERLKKLYCLYSLQMKRLNSFRFPLFYFEEMLKLAAARVFMIELKGKIIAYSFAFEYKDNLYLSIGGVGDFSDYAQYRNYNERIKYACEHKLTIHQGLGTHNTGFDFFKQRVGGVSYKLEQWPNKESYMRIMETVFKIPGAGYALRGIGNLMPEKLIFSIMPFT
jgi:hypothetical protein